MIDTNALVYAFQEDSPHHEAALEVLRFRVERPKGAVLAWQVLFEFLRVVTHPTVAERPAKPAEAGEFIAYLIGLPGVRILKAGSKHFTFYQEAAREIGGARGNDVHDVRLVALMREHGDKEIVTADAGFRRFKGITVEDPRTI